MKKGHFFRSFIPQKVPDRLVLFILRFLSLFSFVGAKTVKTHREENERILGAADFFMPQIDTGIEKAGNEKKAGFYIENQSLWKDIKFGIGKHGNMAYSGCEVIAVYNAIMALRMKDNDGVVNLKESPAALMSYLIESFEKRGSVRRGEFGVAPTAIAAFLKRRGYGVKIYGRKNIPDEAYGNVYIATVYNHSHDITEQIHTVCITKEENGFFIHNSYHRNKHGIYDKKPARTEGYGTLAEAIDNASSKSPKLLYLIGITG